MHPVIIQYLMHVSGQRADDYKMTKEEALAFSAANRYVASLWNGWAFENEEKNRQTSFFDPRMGEEEKPDDSEPTEV